MCDGHGSDRQFIKLEARDTRGREDTKYHEVTVQNIFQRDIKVFFPCCLALTPFHTGKTQTEIKIKIPGWLHVASWTVQLIHRLC